MEEINRFVMLARSGRFTVTDRGSIRRDRLHKVRGDRLHNQGKMPWQNVTSMEEIDRFVMLARSGRFTVTGALILWDKRDGDGFDSTKGLIRAMR